MPPASERIKSLAPPSRSGSEMVAPAVRSSSTSPRCSPSACSNMFTNRQSIQVTTAICLRGACPIMGSGGWRRNCSLCARISSITILFPRDHRIARLAVKVVQVLDLDKIETGIVDAAQQLDHLVVIDWRPMFRGHEAAAPVVGAERLRQSLWPDLCPAIGDYHQLQAITAHLPECLAQLVRASLMPIKEHVHANQFLCLLWLVHRHRLILFMLGRSSILYLFQYLRLLTKARDHRFGKLSRTHLFLAHALYIDVIGMNAILDGAQPGVMYQCRHVRLVDVYEHHHRRQQQT